MLIEPSGSVTVGTREYVARHLGNSNDLEEWVEHRPTCHLNRGGGPNQCSCGLEEALKRLAAGACPTCSKVREIVDGIPDEDDWHRMDEEDREEWEHQNVYQRLEDALAACKRLGDEDGA